MLSDVGCVQGIISSFAAGHWPAVCGRAAGHVQHSRFVSSPLCNLPCRHCCQICIIHLLLSEHSPPFNNVLYPVRQESCLQLILLAAGVLAGVFGTAATGYILKHGTWDEVWGVAVALYLVGAVVWNLFSTGGFGFLCNLLFSTLSAHLTC
jgi:hypothetical protein